MNRRSFLKDSSVLAGGIGLSTISSGKESNQSNKSFSQAFVTIDQEKVSFYSEKINSNIKVIHIADTHLFMDDERGAPFLEYSNRMAKAYNETTHFKNRNKTNPNECFENTLMFAKKNKADLIALVGDIFSFPSELAIEWALSKLKDAGIPYVFVAGNHDWHYEGMKGSLESLRDTWIKKRLLPLYQGNNPLMYAYDVKGIRFLAIDNSTYEINEKQLEFFKQQANMGLPLVLMVHIPMYAPGKNISFGCGNPNWRASSDRNYKLERRPKWPEQGHTQTTFDFYDLVFNTPNLLGIFTGHIHKSSIEITNGIPQIVSDDNASGGYLEIDFLPYKN